MAFIHKYMRGKGQEDKLKTDFTEQKYTKYFKKQFLLAFKALNPRTITFFFFLDIKDFAEL